MASVARLGPTLLAATVLASLDPEGAIGAGFGAQPASGVRTSSTASGLATGGPTIPQPQPGPNVKGTYRTSGSSDQLTWLCWVLIWPVTTGQRTCRRASS